MEVEIRDAGWLNGPTQLLLMQEFVAEYKRLAYIEFVEVLARKASEEAAEQERELVASKGGHYL